MSRIWLVMFWMRVIWDSVASSRKDRSRLALGPAWLFERDRGWGHGVVISMDLRFGNLLQISSEMNGMTGWSNFRLVSMQCSRIDWTSESPALMRALAISRYQSQRSVQKKLRRDSARSAKR